MPRTANRLSDLVIRRAKPDPAGKKSVVLPDGYGLRVVVTPAGNKHFEFKTAIGGKERTARLGRYPDMSLDMAREEAMRLRQLARDGRNPVAEKKIERIRNRVQSETTFEKIAAELLEGKKKNVSAAFHKKIEGGLRANLYPLLGALPIQSIDPPILREALRKIEVRGSLDMLANVRRWAGEVFDYAKAHGQYMGDNPAHALMKNVFKRHESEKMKALAWSELPDFMGALFAMSDGAAIKYAIQLMILTACRPGEIRQAQWFEFNLHGARWTIPGTRMKMKKPHSIPLSKQALAVLKVLQKLTGEGEYLFPGQRGAKTKSITDMALLKAVKRLAGREVHAHGFRATFSTYVSESGLWSDAVKEAALAHGKRGVEGAYDRATHYLERTKLMQWYADEIDKAVTGTNVITIPVGLA